MKAIPFFIVVVAVLAASAAPCATSLDMDLYRELVAIRSVSRDTDAVNRAQRKMKAWLEARGVTCVLERLADGHEVVFASTLPGKVQDYIIAPHLDTVPGEDALFSLREEGDKVFGRGVRDCKGHCVAAAALLVRLNGKASLGCIFGADEECGGQTTREMVERGYTARKMVLVLDGGQGYLIYAQKGNTYFTVVARGKGGHSATPWKTDDQVSRLMLAYAKLRQAWDTKFPLPEDGWTDVLSATYVNGDGGAPNRIPDEASFTVNLRSIRPESADEAEAFIRKVTGLEVVRGRDAKACSSDPNHPLVLRLRDAMVRAYPNDELHLTRIMAATDARCFCDCGVPVMVVGAKGGGEHGSDEWQSLSSLSEMVDWMSAFIEQN